MVNKVLKIVTKDNMIGFIIQTEGDNDFWYWKISRDIWNSFWKELDDTCLEEDIKEWAADIFVNSDECSFCGYSNSNFSTVEEAVSDCLAGKPLFS